MGNDGKEQTLGLALPLVALPVRATERLQEGPCCSNSLGGVSLAAVKHASQHWVSLK